MSEQFHPLVAAPPTCRICMETGDADDLFAPCACAGTIRDVHRACLHEWFAMNHHPDNIRRCNQCRTEYTAEQRISGAWAVGLKFCAGIVHAPFMFVGGIQMLYILLITFLLAEGTDDEDNKLTRPIGIVVAGTFAAVGTTIVAAVSCKLKTNTMSSRFVLLSTLNAFIGGVFIRNAQYAWFPTLGTLLTWEGAKIAATNAAHIMASGLRLAEYATTDRV